MSHESAEGLRAADEWRGGLSGCFSALYVGARRALDSLGFSPRASSVSQILPLVCLTFFMTTAMSSSSAASGARCSGRVLRLTPVLPVVPGMIFGWNEGAEGVDRGS